MAALGEGTLTRVLPRLLDRADGRSPDADELIRRIDGIAGDLAATAQRRGDDAVQALTGAGLAAALDPVPRRLPAAVARLRIGPGMEPTAVDRLYGALAAIGFRPQQRVDGGTVGPGSDGAPLAFIDGDATCRLLVVGAGGPAALDLPARALAEPGDDDNDLGVFLGTPLDLIVPVLDLADPGVDDVVIDLGCGDGRVLIEAVRRFGCRARGVENDPRLVARARERVAAAGLSDRIEVVEGDATGTPVDDITIAFLFLPPDTAAALLPGLLARLPAGARVLAHEQLAVAWPVAPDRSRLLAEGHLTVAHRWTVGADAGDRTPQG